MNALSTALEPSAAPVWSDMTDDDLLAEIARDNKLAFQEITSRYLTKISRVAYRIVMNRHDAEDVAQEVFVSVWNHRTNWRVGEARFSTWLYRVAVNRSIDFRRRRKGTSVELSDEMMDEDEIGADDRVASRQTQEMLLACLKQLPEKQMLALLYFYYEELEIDQICQRLNATEDSVRSLLKRGKMSMRDILAQHHDLQIDQIKLLAPYLLG